MREWKAWQASIVPHHRRISYRGRRSAKDHFSTRSCIRPVTSQLEQSSHTCSSLRGRQIEQSADWSNAAGRCTDNLKTILFLKETKQTFLSASTIKVSDMFSTEGHPEACLGAPAWPGDAGGFNWNATKWNSSWAASCRLSLPIPRLAQPPTEKRWGWNWAQKKNTTSTSLLSFFFYIGNCCMNYILDHPTDFIAGPWANKKKKKLTQNLIYCVISAKWLLLWQQENCMWLRKARRLTHPPPLF